MDCSLPGSSVQWIFQAIVLEGIAISFSRWSSWPRDQTWVSRIIDKRFTIWATREVQENPKEYTEKLLELISEFSKVSFWMVNIQKSIAFIYFNIEQLETESLLKSNTIA